LREVAGLRILALCDYFSLQPSGGAERVAFEAYRRLAQAGAQIVLITTGRGRELSPYEVDGIAVRPVRGHDLSGVASSQLSLAPGAIGAALELSRSFRPHVLHASSIHFQTSIAAAFLHHRSRCPMVLTVHSAESGNLPPVLRVLTAAYERTLGRFLLGSSVQIITVSRAGTEHLLDLGVPRRKITLIPNGVDHGRFQPRDPGASLPSRPLVLFVGRLVANKGANVLLDAVRELPGRDRGEVVFVGDGPLRLGLERAAASIGQAENVRFVGRSNDVAGWLGRTDVLVLPSFAESLSLVLLEAMASGTCIIASDVRGNRELVDDGRTGLLFPPGDHRALARVLRRVLADQLLRARLGAAAHEASLAYTWEACAAATGDVLIRAATTAVR
jgi:glycosyltransferase involved in cell wall biosynthesis